MKKTVLLIVFMFMVFCGFFHIEKCCATVNLIQANGFGNDEDLIETFLHVFIDRYKGNEGDGYLREYILDNNDQRRDVTGKKIKELADITFEAYGLKGKGKFRLERTYRSFGNSKRDIFYIFNFRKIK